MSLKSLILTIASALLSFVANGAPTPIKNLHLYAEVFPKGAGVVYLAPKAKDNAYIKEQSSTFGNTAMLKYTTRENGGKSVIANKALRCMRHWFMLRLMMAMSS